MFDSLTTKFSDIFRRLRGEGALSEKLLDEVLREIRISLLEADVNYKVVKDFVAAVRQRASAAEVIKSLTPAEQVVKIVYEELVNMLGGSDSVPRFRFAATSPTVVMMVGLQGSGKTTTTAKLGKRLKAQGRHPLLVPCDVYRPAAIEQLRRVGAQAGTPVFDAGDERRPMFIALAARKEAVERGYDVLLVDSAGRLHIDDDMMKELEELKRELQPSEILLVADAMTGQDAVKSASEFDRRLGLTGVVLTKLDGDSRGGAALSIRAVTGKPLRYVGEGEKVEALEEFDPGRVASRILGRGDVQGLMERASAAFSADDAEELKDSLRGDSFTLESFRLQLAKIQKMGPLDQLLQMVPGLSRLAGSRDLSVDKQEFVRWEAIISSMTLRERRDHTILDGGRRRRIARGSGRSVQEVNQLLKHYVQMRQQMKSMKKMLSGKGIRGLF